MPAGRRQVKPRPTYHRGNVREDLIALGINILETEQLSAISLRRLTREIGVNPTNFYNHFPNMDQLFAAIKIEGFKDVLKRCRKVTNKLTDRQEAVRALFREYVFFAIQHPNLYRLMFDYYLDFEEYPELKAITDEAMNDVVQLIYDQEVFDSSDAVSFYQTHPKVVACWSMMHGLTHILIERQIKLKIESRKAVHEFSDRMMDVLFHGILNKTID